MNSNKYMKFFNSFRKKKEQGFVFFDFALKEIEKAVTIVEKIPISKDTALTPIYKIVIYEKDYDLLVSTMIRIGMLKPKSYR